MGENIWYLWIGGAGGTVLGWMAVEWVGVLPGAAAGLTLGRVLYLAPFSPRRWGADMGEVGQGAFLTALFVWAGYLAKADGRVSEREIAVTRGIMEELGLSNLSRHLAIELFQRGKRARFPQRAVTGRLRRGLRDRPERLRRFLELQLRVACADGTPAPIQETRLRELAQQLGISAAEVAGMLRRRRKRQEPARHGSHSPLAEAYRLLEVAETASAEEIKRAYRLLVSRHHPDRLEGRGLPEAELRAAADRTRAVREAYEAIRRERGF